MLEGSNRLDHHGFGLAYADVAAPSATVAVASGTRIGSASAACSTAAASAATTASSWGRRSGLGLILYAEIAVPANGHLIVDAG